MRGRLTSALRVATVGLVGVSPFLFGAEHAVVQSVLFSALLAVEIVYFVSVAGRGRLFARDAPIPRAVRVGLLCAAGFVAWAAVQTFPLPGFLVRLLSPAAALIRLRAFEHWTITGAQSLSMSLWRSKTALLFAAACLGLIWMVFDLFRRQRFLILLMHGLIAVGAVLSVEAIWQHMATPERIYGFWLSRFGGHAFGPYVNPNHFAAFVGPLVPLGVAAYLCDKQRLHMLGRLKVSVGGGVTLWDALLLLCTGLMIVAVLMSNSRAGIGCSLGASAIVVTFATLRKSANRIIAWIKAGLFVAVVGVLAWVARGNVIEAVRAPEDWRSIAERLDVWRATCRMFFDFPLAGTGLGTWAAVFPGYQPDTVGVGAWPHAHGDWVQLLAETGVVGAALAAGFVVCLVLVFLRHHRLHTSYGYVRLGAAMGLAALAAHGGVEFPFRAPSVMLSASTVCGLLLAAAYHSRRLAPMGRGRPESGEAPDHASDHGPAPQDEALRERARPPRDRRLTWTAGLCALACFLLLPHALALRLADRGDYAWAFDDLRPEARDAVARRLAGQAGIHYRLANEIYSAARSKGADEEALARAVGLYQKAIVLEPSNSLYHGAFGWFLLENPQVLPVARAEGFYQLARAQDLWPADPYQSFSIGYLYLQTGERDRALQLFRRSAELDRRYIPGVIATLLKEKIPPSEGWRALPLDAWTYEKWALACEKAGQNEAAKTVWRYTARISAEMTIIVRIGLAHTLVGRGMQEEADRLMARLAARYADDASVRVAYAAFCLKWGQPDRAEAFYREALARQPNAIPAIRGYTAFLVSQKRYREAETLLTRSIRLIEETDPRGAASLLLVLATNWERQGRPEEVELCAERAVELVNLRDFEIVSGAAQLLAAAGRRDMATAILETAVLRIPANARLHYLLAQTYRESDDLVGAMHQLERAKELDPSSDLYRRELAKVRRELDALRRLTEPQPR